ncbi:MAG: hypothetical protein AB7K24_32785 [Gemmataceae bacterium]
MLMRMILFGNLVLVLGSAMAAPVPEGEKQPIDLKLHLYGRATQPATFEPGEPVSFHLSMINDLPRKITWNSYPDLRGVELTIAQLGSKDQPHRIYPIDRAVQGILKSHPTCVFDKAANEDFVSVDSKKSAAVLSLMRFRDQKGNVVIRTGGGESWRIPPELIARPGEYRLQAIVKNEDKRGWVGQVSSAPITLTVLSAEQIAEMEKGLKVTRQQAADLALQAAQNYFKMGKPKYAHPLRLFVRDGKKYWHAEFIHDNGLVARWVDIYIDGPTGEVTVKRSPKVGA